MRILVAEDNASSRVMLVRLLTRCGHDVVAVATGTEALEKLQALDAPRLAILDRQMPGLDGTDVCRRLRAGPPPARPIHLVLLTSLGDKEDVITGLEAGADDYLTKPIDARELKARLVAWARILGSDAEASAPDEPPAISGGEPEVTALDAHDPSSPARRRSSRDLVGSIVAGKYQILELLGSGGMGVVYKARHTLLDEVVALKVLHDAMAERPEVRERFLREAKATMKFNHPNAIPVRDFGIAENGAPFMTLAYSNGKSLRALLGEVGRFPTSRALSIVRQCLLALGEAHAHGIIHRDLKPENVLVETAPDRGDVPLICDFGMAKLRGSGTGADDNMTGHSVIGTPHYMAPEQASGDSVDHRVDLYAMGCVLYELVTGTKVFQAESAGQILMKHVTQTPELPSKRASGIPPRLEKLIMRALAKAPEARPQTAAAFIEGLDEVSAPLLRPARSVKVLLAEDNVVNQRLTARILEKRGYEVTIANDGVEALALLDRESFDVVLMDGEMPRLDGFQTTAEIRSRDQIAGRHTPIVAVMGANREADRQWCLAAGMDEHVAKPIDASALFDAIGKVVRTSRTRESRSETMRRETNPFEASVALARVEGDRELFGELVRLFLSESTRLVSAIRGAIDAQDPAGVQHAAHELRGVAANCSANVVAKAAEELEQLAARRDLQGATAAFKRLDLAVESVQPAILATLGGAGGPARA